MSIPVVWLNHERMSFSCTNMLNEVFDHYGCEHYTNANFDGDGAVLVFHGGGACLPVGPFYVNSFIRRWRWAIVISIGDEATSFPYQGLIHHNMKLWIQAPLPTTKADRYLIQGYPAHTVRSKVEKDLDWVFMGQNTHERRHACINALNPVGSRLSGGILVPTSGFGQGLPQGQYLHAMSRARMAPCPAGLSTPDSFRVYEALECGAIPILDAVSLRPETRGVWPLLLGDHPLPIIEDWSTLPSVLDEWLTDWERRARWIQAWWRAYKYQFRDMLAIDLLSLGVSNERSKEESPRIAAAP